MITDSCEETISVLFLHETVKNEMKVLCLTWWKSKIMMKKELSSTIFSKGGKV